MAHQELGAPGLVDDTFIVSFVATPVSAHELGLFFYASARFPQAVDAAGLTGLRFRSIGNLRFTIDA